METTSLKHGRHASAIFPDTLEQLADRWTVLINQVNRHAGPYPEPFYADVSALVHQTWQLIGPGPFERDVLLTARQLAEDGNLKMALFRLNEVIEARLQGRLF